MSHKLQTTSSSQNPPRREPVPDSSASGGVPLEPSEVSAFRLRTFATLSIPVQLTPPQSMIHQPSEYTSRDMVIDLIEAVDGLCYEDDLNEKLRAVACKEEDLP